MNSNFTPTRLSGFDVIKMAWNRIADSQKFLNIWVLGLIVSALATLILGAIDIVVDVVVVAALAFTGNFPAINQVGWPFALTGVSLGVFDLTFGPLSLGDYNSKDPQQPVLNLTFWLSLVCLVATSLGAYLVLVQTPSATAVVVAVPVFNLILSLWDVWAWFQS